jgi:UDP-N-acetylmuramoylalanine--D-glutamate ligase
MKYIYGLSKSGKSIINYLNKINEQYCCWDDNAKVRRQIKINQLSLIEPQNINFKLINEAYITPGISLKHSKIKCLKKNDIKMFRDLELYSQISKGKKIISITGTNGKSTTTKLISEMLFQNNINNFAGGNLGTPLLDFVKFNKSIKFHVVELSSFQLESTISFNPFISILLNISPDHLDRYIDYEEYISQKEKIIKFNRSGYNIICVDDIETLKIYKKHSSNKKTIPISSKYIKNGVYFEGNILVDNFFEKNFHLKILNTSHSLFGSFNKQNILATYVVAKLLSLDTLNFLKVIQNFKGLPYRMEKIFINDRIQIINNSKATNLDSSLKSINNYENIILILGGIAKEKNFLKILEFKKKIKKIYLIGQSAMPIYDQLKNTIDCEVLNTIDLTVDKIFYDIKNQNSFFTILFAPACSSYDQFKNYEDRGEKFTSLIKKKTNE